MKTERPISLAVHLASSLREARRAHRRRLKRCRHKFSAKAVHDLRVQTRRLLAMLDFLKAAGGGGAPGKIRERLKRRFDAFGDLRDTQVQLRLLRPLERTVPGARAFSKLLQRRETRFIRRGRNNAALLKPGREAGQLKQLEKHLQAAAAKTPAREHEIALAALQASFDKVVRLRRRIRGKDAAAVHKMRLAFKRFRYMSELLQPVLAGADKSRLRRMRRFQALAGDIQDLEILAARLDEFIREKKLRADAMRSLRNALARRKNRALDLFLKQLGDLKEFQPEGRSVQSGTDG